MSTPTPSEIPEEWLAAARQEARSVYQTEGVIDSDGQHWTFTDLVNEIAELQGGQNRRTFMKAAAAFFYISVGFSAPAAIIRSMSEPAAAATGQIGTSADALSTLFTDSIDSQAQLTSWNTGYDDHSASVSSATTTSGEKFIDVDTSVGGVTITLASADAVEGHRKAIRQNGSNDVTVDTEGTENIDGSSSYTISKDKAIVEFEWNGNEWVVYDFTDTVDARTITTGSIGNSGAPVTLDDDLEAADGVGLQSSENKGVFFAPTNHPSLADNGKVQLTTRIAEEAGLVFVINRSDAEVAAFELAGGFDSATEIFDPSNSFTTTEGNDGTTNVYHDSTNNRYELENKTGSSRNYSVWMMG